MVAAQRMLSQKKSSSDAAGSERVVDGTAQALCGGGNSGAHDAVAQRLRRSAGAPSSSLPLPRAWVLAGFALATALASTALPLLTYTLALAMFGLAHVLAELRYVDERFGPRVGRTVRWQMLTLLAIVVAGRTCVIAGIVSSRLWQPAELLAVALLAFTAWPRLRRAGILAAGFALAVVAGLASGAIWAPEATLLALAVAHNVTPAGFLAERLRGAQRRRALFACAVLVGVAAVIATGLPTRWLASIGWWQPEASVLPSAGKLSAHLGAYVPRSWRASEWGIAFFSAAVFLQCQHYGAVLHVLPRLNCTNQSAAGGAHAQTGGLRWPRWSIFIALVVFASLLLFGGFVISFSDARALYSLAAAVHAWIEIPLLLLALAPAKPVEPRAPDLDAAGFLSPNL